MVFVNDKECAAAGIDPGALRTLANRLEAVATELQKAGCFIFGGSGRGTIRVDDRGKRPLIVAEITDGSFDGGDGAITPDRDGLFRGE